MAKNRLLASGQRMLKEMRDRGRGSSRHQDKLNGETAGKIYADRSLIAHERAWGQFAEWAHAQGVKNLKQVKPETVTEFLQFKATHGGRDGDGATHKTLKGYLTSINRVMGEAGNEWKQMEMKKLPIEGKRGAQDGYKPLTASEWVERNPETYERYRDTFDTMRAFGLRDRELNELNQHSFVRDEVTGKLYAQTIGKGGKFRLAECREDLRERMEALHGSHIRVLDTSRVSAEVVASNIQDQSQRLNLYGANNHKIPKHIFRADYAQHLLEQKLAEARQTRPATTTRVNYSALDKIPKSEWGNCSTKIGGYEGNAQAFLEVSRALGHNRLDVLLKYL